MKMPQKLVYEVKYKVISHAEVNKIKARIVMSAAWLLNLLFKLKIELIYCEEGIKEEKINCKQALQ